MRKRYGINQLLSELRASMIQDAKRIEQEAQQLKRNNVRCLLRGIGEGVGQGNQYRWDTEEEMLQLIPRLKAEKARRNKP